MSLERQLAFVLLLAFIFTAGLFLYQGNETNQSDIEARALKLKYQECYKWQDIEYIIHGETQE